MPDGASEFVYTAADFSRIRRMLHERSDMVLGESKRSMVYNRLVHRLRARHLTRFDRYLDIVEADADEREACLNALTTNRTAFFGEPHQLTILGDYVKRRRFPRLRVWCAAASTGEEPYSIAMTLIEAYGSETPPVEIIASDSDPDVLVYAQRGVYELERLATVSDRRRARFFQRGDGPNTGFARIGPALRAMIDYRYINLHDSSWALPSGLDVIICRNVLNVYEQAVQRDILQRFESIIAADGLLITGQTAYRSKAGLRVPASRT